MTYGIKNTETGLFFGGFSSDASVKWVEKGEAYPMDRLSAKAQAALLVCNSYAVQRKPVAL